MKICELKNEIPMCIRYDKFHNRFWYNTLDATDSKEIFIADYQNHNMKCFDNKFGTWDDTSRERKYVLEISD